MESKQQLFERDLREMAREIEKKGNEINFSENGEVIVKEILKEKINNIVSVPINNSTVFQTDQTKQFADNVLPNYLEKESPEVKNKIEKLIMLTFNSGLDEAIKQAGMSGPFVLDALHDALTSKLYNELKKRKLLK